MNRIEYVYKKGPFSKPSLFDTVDDVDSSDLAETIRRKRLDEQHASWYPYNKFAYRMGPEKDLGEALWSRIRNYNLSLQYKSRPIAGARLMLSVSKSTELQASSSSASVDEPTVPNEGNSSSETSEESESESDSYDEEKSQDTRTEYLRQGTGENVEMLAGMISPTMTRLRPLTSISTCLWPLLRRFQVSACVVVLKRN